METEKNIIRKFKVEDQEYTLIKPNARISREAKLAYTKAWTQAIKEGFFLKEDLKKLLRDKNNSFVDENEAQQDELRNKIVELQEILDNSKNLTADEMENAATLLASYRAALIETDKILNEILSNTAESIAEEEKFLVLIAGCTLNSQGNKVWDSLESLLDEKDVDLVANAKFEMLCVEYQIEPDWQKNLPEYKAIEEIKNKREEEAKSVEKSTKDSEETVEDAGNKEESVKKSSKPSSKKKSTTKKTTKTELKS